MTLLLPKKCGDRSEKRSKKLAYKQANSRTHKRIYAEREIERKSTRGRRGVQKKRETNSTRLVCVFFDWRKIQIQIWTDSFQVIAYSYIRIPVFFSGTNTSAHAYTLEQQNTTKIVHDVKHEIKNKMSISNKQCKPNTNCTENENEHACMCVCVCESLFYYPNFMHSCTKFQHNREAKQKPNESFVNAKKLLDAQKMAEIAEKMQTGFLCVHAMVRSLCLRCCIV